MNSFNVNILKTLDRSKGSTKPDRGSKCLNPSPTVQGRNQPLYKRLMTKSGRNRVKKNCRSKIKESGTSLACVRAQSRRNPRGRSPRPPPNHPHILTAKVIQIMVDYN